jgi:mono/diheme cytochrome c family protein
MKKYKLAIGISILATAVIVYSCKTKRFETTKTSYTASASPQALERGKVLAYSICAGCHYNRSANKFIGMQILDVPGIAGKVYSANLTKSQSHGIPPHYSDAQLKYLLKTGVANDGRFIPYMLRPNMAEEDLNAIIVYLRSDDPGVAAADTTVGITHYNLIGKGFMNMKAKPLPYKQNIQRPSENNPVALGRYLVDNIGCFHCHSKSLTSINYLNPEQTKGYLAGGLKLKGEQGMEVVASNITPDKQTGIGNYTEQQFLRALKDGQAPARKLKPPMPRFQKLSDGEVDAIYAYLLTVPAKYHKIQ